MVEKRAQQLGEFIAPLMGSGDFPPLEVEDTIEVSEDPDKDIFFIDKVPGAPDAQEIMVKEDDGDKDIEVEADPQDNDPWHWTHSTFIPWVSKMIDNCPKHSGYDVSGLEKCIGYFGAILREFPKALRTDFKNEIDIDKAEKAREQIIKAIERLEDRLERVSADKYGKKKKSWAVEAGLIKEAGTTNITGITITVPLLISTIARVCINGMVSAGHDMEDMFKRQAEEYSLDKREQAELSQLLSDMGYSMIRDRGYPAGTSVKTWKNDNFDFSAQYND
jgi:hypothetical protein